MRELLVRHYSGVVRHGMHVIKYTVTVLDSSYLILPFGFLLPPPSRVGELAAASPSQPLRFGRSTRWSTRGVLPNKATSPTLWQRRGGWLSGAELAACWWCWLDDGSSTQGASKGAVHRRRTATCRSPCDAPYRQFSKLL